MIVMVFFFYGDGDHLDLHVLTHSFPTRRCSRRPVPAATRPRASSPTAFRGRLMQLRWALLLGLVAGVAVAWWLSRDTPEQARRKSARAEPAPAPHNQCSPPDL